MVWENGKRQIHLWQITPERGLQTARDENFWSLNLRSYLKYQEVPWAKNNFIRKAYAPPTPHRKTEHKNFFPTPKFAEISKPGINGISQLSGHIKKTFFDML